MDGDRRPADDTPAEGISPESRLFTITRVKLTVAASAAAVIYLAGVIGRWWPTPDSAVYLGLAQSLADGSGYRFNGAVNTTFAPGLPLILAAMMRASGGYWLPNLFIALCGLATIVVIYLSMRILVRDAQIAFASTLATAFSYPFFLYSHRILSDVPFALLFWLAVYASLRLREGGAWWLAGLAVSVVAAVTVRAPGILLIAPVALGLALQGPPGGRRRWSAAVCMLLAAAAAAAVLYALAHSASAAAPGYVRLVGSTVRRGQIGYIESARRAFAMVPHVVSEMLTSQDNWMPSGVVIAAFGAAGLVRLFRRRDFVVALALLAYPALLFAALGSFGMRPRYLLPVTPLVVYAYFMGVGWAIDALFARRGKAWTLAAFRWAVIVITTAGVTANLPRMCRDAFHYSALSRTSRFPEAVRATMRTDVFAARDVVERFCPPGAKVGVPPDEATMLAYLTGRLTTPLLEETKRFARSDARNVVNLVRARNDIDFVLIDDSIGAKALVDGIISALDAQSDLKAVYRGKGVLYERVR